VVVPFTYYPYLKGLPPRRLPLDIREDYFLDSRFTHHVVEARWFVARGRLALKTLSRDPASAVRLLKMERSSKDESGSPRRSSGPVLPAVNQVVEKPSEPALPAFVYVL
jgi:hypothetical protein